MTDYLAAGTTVATAAYSFGTQMYAQVMAVIIAVIWTSVVSIVALLICKAVFGLRVKEQEEREGLDLVERSRTVAPGIAREQRQRLQTGPVERQRRGRRIGAEAVEEKQVGANHAVGAVGDRDCLASALDRGDGDAGGRDAGGAAGLAGGADL